MLKRLGISLVVAALVAAAFALTTASPSAQAAEDPCPPPAGGSGQVINGPLIVDGTCTIWGMTIRGDVTINGTGRLILLNSTVLGNINVVAGGRLDTGTTNIQLRVTDTITGSIVCTNSGNFTFTGTTCSGSPTAGPSFIVAPIPLLPVRVMR